MIVDPVEKHLEQQIEAFAMMRSPLYAGVTQHLLDDYRANGIVNAFFHRDPARAGASTPGVRLMGALHYLALTGEAPELAAHLPSCGGDANADALWAAAREALREREERIGELFAETPQTNEVLRAVVLSAGLARIAKDTGLPLRLFEIGASAGLNTRIAGDYRVEERAACDLHPLDVNSDRDCVRLLSFVWADDGERMERLRDAVERARRDPLTVERADMFEWLAQRVAPKRAYVTVVMHSVVADHLSKEQRNRLAEMIASIGNAAANDAPFAWLRMEFDPLTRRYATQVQLWPGPIEQIIATSTGHGRDIEWIA